MEPKIPIDMGGKIRKILIKQKRSVTWLADEIDHDQSSLNKKLRRQHLNHDLLWDISHALGVNLFACYSDCCAESIRGRSIYS